MAVYKICYEVLYCYFFFFSSRRRHTRLQGDWSSDVCSSDLGHHTVEDVGITLGTCLAEALGDKAGIARFGSGLFPLDEALVEVALDLSGRQIGRASCRERV